MMDRGSCKSQNFQLGTEAVKEQVPSVADATGAALARVRAGFLAR